MSLIDLAGSERATDSYKTDRSKGLHREGCNINKSLLALGNCINALSNSSKQKSSYIPYRSSKLTLILRDSLGGNCQTLMIATVSPSLAHYEQSHNTLLYAERAKGVQLNVRKNNVTVAIQPRDYKQIIDKSTLEITKLRKELEQLREDNHKLKTQAASVPNHPITSSREAIEKLHSVKNTVDDLFAQRIQLRQQLLECEHNIKLIDLRLMFKKTDNEHITILNGDIEPPPESELKTSKAPLSLHSQKLHYSDLLTSLINKVEDNEDKIKRLESELLEKTNHDIVVRSYFIENNSTAQAKDVEFAQKHVDQIMEELFSRNQSHLDLNSLSHTFCYRSYSILKVQGLLTTEMEDRYHSIVRKIEGKKSVVWTDDVDSPAMAKMKDKVDLSRLPIYMNSTLTPADKRNLVSVRDITPIQINHNKTPFRNVNHNVNPNMGNTITKSKSTAFVSPSARSVSLKFEKENFSNPGYYSRRSERTPDRGNYWSSDNSNYARSSAKRSFNRTYSNSNFNNEPPATYSSSRNKNSYGYNPNFRPKFRN